MGFPIRKDRLHFRRLAYYAGSIAHMLVPRFALRAKAKRLLAGTGEKEMGGLLARADYYNKLGHPFTQGPGAGRCGFNDAPSSYFFDFHKYARCFGNGCKYHFDFGDRRMVPPQPTFIKARPVAGPNENSVLLKLDSLRHFRFVRDKIPFSAKSPTAVFRGACHQPHRRAFLENTAGMPGTDIGDTRANAGQRFKKNRLTIAEQLGHKFIISIEGNDVATNLKWILSSNSLCLMARPQLETWFMEGLLEPGRHYVELRSDYADLPEKIGFYSHNPAAAQEIIANAHAHVRQFKDPKSEAAASILVIAKYLFLSGQLDPSWLQEAGLPAGLWARPSSP